jgi:hypothetical protein
LKKLAVKNYILFSLVCLALLPTCLCLDSENSRGTYRYVVNIPLIRQREVVENFMAILA